MATTTMVNDGVEVKVPDANIETYLKRGYQIKNDEVVETVTTETTNEEENNVES